LKKRALANVPEPERAQLIALSNRIEPGTSPVRVVSPRGPGDNYTVDGVMNWASEGLKHRSFEIGRDMFSAAKCSLCHRFNGEGGGVGPDLTAAAGRFSLRDLLENIIEPSKVISDQYESTVVEKKDGSTVVGVVLGEEAGNLRLATNPLARDEIASIPVAQIKRRMPNAVSSMPPGLINTLNRDELLDLLAYIQSGGVSSDKMFAKP